MAGFYESQGQYKEAERLYCRAMDGCSRVLGENHMETLKLTNDLAALRYSLGDYAQVG